MTDIEDLLSEIPNIRISQDRLEREVPSMWAILDLMLFNPAQPCLNRNWYNPIPRISDLGFSPYHIRKLFEFIRSNKEEDRADQHRIFGRSFIDVTRGRMMGTLYEDHAEFGNTSEFRLWMKVPGLLGTDYHIDSMGCLDHDNRKNLVFRATGQIRYIRSIQEVIYPKSKYTPINITQSVKLFREDQTIR